MNKSASVKTLKQFAKPRHAYRPTSGHHWALQEASMNYWGFLGIRASRQLSLTTYAFLKKDTQPKRRIGCAPSTRSMRAPIAPGPKLAHSLTEDLMRSSNNGSRTPSGVFAPHPQLTPKRRPHRGSWHSRPSSRTPDSATEFSGGYVANAIPYAPEVEMDVTWWNATFVQQPFQPLAQGTQWGTNGVAYTPPTGFHQDPFGGQEEQGLIYEQMDMDIDIDPEPDHPFPLYQPEPEPEEGAEPEEEVEDPQPEPALPAPLVPGPAPPSPSGWGTPANGNQPAWGALSPPVTWSQPQSPAQDAEENGTVENNGDIPVLVL